MRPKVSAPDGSPQGVRTTCLCVTSSSASCVRPVPPMMASMSGSLHRVDCGQVAPRALHVHAAAEDVAVRNAEPDEVRPDRLGPAGVLFRQHRAVHLLRTV